MGESQKKNRVGRVEGFLMGLAAQFTCFARIAYSVLVQHKKNFNTSSMSKFKNLVLARKFMIGHVLDFFVRHEYRISEARKAGKFRCRSHQKSIHPSHMIFFSETHP